MSESMSAPWIHDYLIGIAETYGAQLYNAPVTKTKKRVQLTDLLTYQENSYVWAWVSDKDYRISVRLSKDAIDEYKKRHGRSIIDSRFFLVFIGSYRPIFSPRPLGTTARGNTPASHISLEIDYVSSVGIGGHLFGNPRDLELDDKMNEWVLGLRQDGGGGNILKLRKQREQAQNKNLPPSPPPPPPFSLYAPESRRPPTRDAKDDVKFEPERPYKHRRTYTKLWRKIELDPLMFFTKPAAEGRPVTGSSDSLAEPLSDTTIRLENRKPSPRPTSVCCTPSSALQRQGTPTEWSPSIKGSPVAAGQVTTVVSRNELQQHESHVLPTVSHPLLDTEAHKMNITIALESSSPPPTPAQRIKHLPLPRSSPPPRSSPVRSQPPRSSPLPPSPSLVPPPSSFPVPVEIWKNVQRKVPHPGLPVLRPDPTNHGPARILVPNSDTSGSQSYSQSQCLSQSQHCQVQSQAHPPTFLTCLPKEIQLVAETTPRDNSEMVPESKMSVKVLPTDGDNTEQEAPLSGDKHSTDNADADIGEQEGSASTRLPAQNTRKPEVLEVGTSDTEDEADVLRLTDDNAWVEAKIATLSKAQDAGASADHEDSQLSTDDADIHLALRGIPPRRSPAQATTLEPSSLKQHTENIPVRPLTPSPELPERPGSRGSMHSLFSASFEEEQSVASQLLVSSVVLKDGARPARVPRHDAEAWKEPSFISKYKGKGKARAMEEPATPSTNAGKKRRLSTQAESPMRKHPKRPRNGRQVVSGQAITDQDAETSTQEKTHPRNRPSTSSRNAEAAIPPLIARLSKPRLANFLVNFESIDLGKGVPIPRLDLDKDIKSTLLRTGRIRTLGEGVEKDGSVYIHS